MDVIITSEAKEAPPDSRLMRSMGFINDTDAGPAVVVRLNHPMTLPVYLKVHNYLHHPREGPPMVLLSGVNGARTLSETLINYTHNSSHVLPMFDDGGSSRVLRERLGMPPPGDLRNRLISLSDMSMSGNPEVSRLFRTRLPRDQSPGQLQDLLYGFLSEEHPQMERIGRPYRRIIINHLTRFNRRKPEDFDLRGGSIGNFVIAGAYLSVGDLEAVIFEFSALAAARGKVFPVCRERDLHLKAELADGTALVGQSRITNEDHAPIKRLSIVTIDGEEQLEARPRLNPAAEAAINRTALIAYSMSSFYTSLISNLLVDGIGQVIRRTKRPKVLVANLMQDHETRGMTVSMMLEEMLATLRQSDPSPGEMRDYVHYALVGDHGESEAEKRIPVDLKKIRGLGVEPIVLPLEKAPGKHKPDLVAAVLLSLC